jgi:Flp pilus assembly protein TadD
MLLAFVAVLMLLSACTTTTNRQLSTVPLGEFQEYAASSDSMISPESVADTIPDADILYLSDEVTSMLDKKVMPISNNNARLNAIIKILNNKVKWDTTSDRYATKTAMGTYQTGTGNCLSFANLFVAMARYAGFDAGYQEVSTGPNWTREGGVLFISKHISATATINSFYSSDVELVFTDDNEVMIETNHSGNTFTSIRSSSVLFQEDEVQVTPIPDYRAFAQYYNNIASMNLAEGNPSLAFSYFIKALETDPSLEFVWSNLGVAYSRNKQWAAAEEAYLQALAIAQGTNDVAVLSIMNNMVKLYERSGNSEKAAFYQKEVAAFRDQNPYFHYLAGQSAFTDASYEESIKCFKAAIRRKQDEDLFYYSLAMAYLKLGNIRKAEKNIDKAKYYAWDDQKREYYGKVLQKISKIAVN